MLSLAKRKLIRLRQQIRNPGEDRLVVWLEPWADRFELAAREALDIVFVGPDTSGPEILPYPGELVIYGWEGSEAFVLQNGFPVGHQATVNEVVQQELSIAKDRIRVTARPWPAEEIEHVQSKLEFAPDLSSESQCMACESASYLIHELASMVERSDAAAIMLWQIADRILAKKGLVLAAPSRRTLKATLWGKGPDKLFELVSNHALSVLPGPANVMRSGDPKSLSKQRRAESESDPALR